MARRMLAIPRKPDLRSLSALVRGGNIHREQMLSALPPKAEIEAERSDFRHGPGRESCIATKRWLVPSARLQKGDHAVLSELAKSGPAPRTGHCKSGSSLATFLSHNS